MSVTLINNTRRMKVFTLAHKWYCEARGACACKVVPGKEERRIAGSLTIPAGGIVENLSDAVLEVPDVKTAVASGALTVRRVRSRRSRRVAPGKSKPTKSSKRSKK
jgi:hypothetical protein